MKVSWREVIRDALAVLLLIFVGDWLLRFALGPEIWLDVRGVVRILLAGAAFAVIGGWQPERRIRHIVLVGLVAWVGTLANLLGTGHLLVHWILGLIPLAIGVALGCASGVAMGALRTSAPGEDKDAES